MIFTSDGESCIYFGYDRLVASMVGRNRTPYLRRLELMCPMSALHRGGASNRLGADVVHWQRGRWLEQQYKGDMVLLLFLAHKQ